MVAAKSGKLIATIPLSGKPEFAAVDDDAGRVYCTIEDKNEVAVIDTSGSNAAPRWSLVDPAGKPPLAQLAVFRAGRGKELVGFERKSGSQPLDRREPDFLLAAGLDLLEEVLGKVGNLGQLLLRQVVPEPELFQTKPNPIQ